MRQIVVARRGGPEVLHYEEAPDPVPGPGEVLVRVEAAGVSFADLLVREGLYPGAPRPPFVPGYDVAGTVEAAGEGTPGPGPGSRVVAVTRFGGYAEKIALAASLCVPLPDGLPSDMAVALALNYLTAYQLLHRVARVREGESILVHGAAGGVGTALLDLSRLEGLRVYGTASAPKQPVVAELGATPLGYRESPQGKLPTGGVDVAFDPVGGRSWTRSYRLLAPGGRLVAYGFSAATTRGRRNLPRALREWALSPRYMPLGLMRNSRAVLGYDAGSLRLERPDWYQADLAAVLKLAAEGQLHPRVDSRFPLAEAAVAHRRLGSGQALGKIVLVPDLPSDEPG